MTAPYCVPGLAAQEMSDNEVTKRRMFRFMMDDGLFSQAEGNNSDRFHLSQTGLLWKRHFESSDDRHTCVALKRHLTPSDHKIKGQLSFLSPAP